MNYLFYVDLLGCSVFAISGAIMAYQQKMDGFGVLVLAAVTAIGGGTVRDLLLDTPVFWLHQPAYIYTIVTASLFAIFWLNTSKTIPHRALEFADALGLALFVVMGTQKALSFGVSGVTAVILGTMTGCFGGIIRDVIANQVPMVLQKELYAVCCICGGVTFVVLTRNATELIAACAAFSVVLLLRLAAIKWRWSMPVFKYD